MKGWDTLLQADYPAGVRPTAVAHHPVLPLVALAYDDSLIEVPTCLHFFVVFVFLTYHKGQLKIKNTVERGLRS